MKYNFEKLNILEQFGDFSKVQKPEFININSGENDKDNSTIALVVVLVIVMSIVAFGIYEKNKEDANKKFEKRN